MLLKVMAILAAKFAQNRYARSGKDWRQHTVKYHPDRAEWEAQYRKPGRRAEWEAQYRKPETRRRG